MFVSDGLLNPPGGAPLLGAGALVYPDSGLPITWTVDATSGKGVPADATEWDDVLTAAGITSGGPSNLWLLQEASAPFADSIGSADFDQAGTVATQQAAAGWSRTAIAPAPSSNSGAFLAGLGGLSSSALLFAVLKIGFGTGGDTGIMSLGADESPNWDMRIVRTVPITTARIGIDEDVNYPDGSDAINGAFHPVLLQVDTTNNVCKLYTDLEIVTGGWSEPGSTSGAVWLGASPDSGYNVVNGGLAFVYAALFTGSAAELADADIRSLLQTLSWSVPW